MNPDHLFVSVLTLAEIQRGIELLPLGKRRSQLEAWLETELLESFAEENILAVTKAIGDRWARLTARAQSEGVQTSVIDGFLAATALHHGLTLVMRNERDFVRLGVMLLNPFLF